MKNNCIRKPSNKQCELARLLTKSNISDAQIIEELASMTEAEWYKNCEILKNFIVAHDMPLNEGWALMCNDFYNIAAANDVNEATLFIAFMKWLNK